MKRLIFILTIFGLFLCSSSVWAAISVTQKIGSGSYSLTSSKIGASQNIGTQKDGLVGWWTFDGSNVNATQILDVSGNVKHGTRTAITMVAGKTGQGGSFNGTTSLVNSGNVSAAVNSIGFWMKTASSTTKLIDLNGTANLELVGNTITANNFTNPTIYVNDIISSTITSNQWNYVLITTATAINASAVKFGNVGSLYYSGYLDDIRIYNKAFSQQEVKSLYNQGGSKINASQSIGTQKDGLIAHWTFDGNKTNATQFQDSVGTNQGTRTDGVGVKVGKIGQGGNFDGLNDTVKGSDQPFSFTNTTFTVSFWGKTGSSAQMYGVSQGGGVGGWTVGISSSIAAAILKDGSTNFVLGGNIGSTNIADNKWHLFTFIITTNTTSPTGNRVSFYRDNAILDGTITGSDYNYSVAGGEVWAIGARSGGTSLFWKGSLDDVRIYNRALSQQEILSLYNQGK